MVTLLEGPFDPSQHALIFTHVPKCGGTSLHETLAGLIGRDRYRVFTGEPYDRALLPKLLGAGGHQRFGQNPTHAQGRGIVYVTVLRDPLDRFRSFFNHVRRVEGHPLRVANPVVGRMAPRELIDYLDEIKNPSVSNFASWMLAPGARTAEDVISHVERNYSLVGILENMTGFHCGLSKMFPGYKVETFNLNRTRDFMEPIVLDNPLLIERVREINELDYALYEHFRVT